MWLKEEGFVNRVRL
jgi:hypothetical protein